MTGNMKEREQQYPEPTVGALIFNPEGKIFLMRSHKWRGKFVIPGGHIELGEKIEDALQREIREETGLGIHNLEFICVQEFIFNEVFWQEKHFIFFDYSCKTDFSEVTLNSEGQDYVWVTIEEALKLPVEPFTRRTIKEYLKRQR